jgi:hypothetical protein
LKRGRAEQSRAEEEGKLLLNPSFGVEMLFIQIQNMAE